MIPPNLVNFLAAAGLNLPGLIRRNSLVTANQNLALSGVIGGSDQAFLLHTLDQRGGAVVATAEASLNIAGRHLTVLEHDGDRLVIEIVAGLTIAFAIFATLFVVGRLLLGDGFEVIRHTLLLEVSDDLFDFLVGNERPVHA